ncbi:GNAT family N-acetyltransferase [Lapillicoccus jejuensis]|uniref:L-amino acid N-acyltransferase YncA n=1 Tax=Lapillicoccus jejuensis TaxID=402171 RepID=A0A542E3W4_9MICO|nr:GNAT family N-acetyltransferase [Lapillicoccus jejuensis]TQJ10032.1 L-amino acid N-acyltransferase YncA [Lapillicoccus jejuensis]
MNADHDHPHGHAHGSGPVADASVRLARPADAPAVGVVQAAVWVQTYGALLPPEALGDLQPPAFARVWRESLEHPPSARHRLLVACAGEQVVGMAAVGPGEDPDAGSDDAELLVLGVHPGAREQGHGSRLVNAAVDTARGAGATVLRAWIPDPAVAVRRFLTAAGLEPDGAFRDRVIGPSDTDVLRELRLSSAI